MTNATALATTERQPRSVLVDMSSRYGMEPAAFEATLRATVCKGSVTREEFAAFLLVAKEYRLNPLTKEIYAFPAKGGGIQPIVSIDGWSRIINDHPMFDGMEFEDVREGGDLIAVTCRMHRKDRTRSIETTEYMTECRRGTDVWKTWPRRMLRHKAMIQCARYAFGFGGIVDPDEYERIVDVTPATRDRPDVRQRLEARGEEEREGFSATAAIEIVDSITGEVTEPTASDDLGGDAIPAEFTGEEAPADETFPGEAAKVDLADLGLKTGADLLAEKSEPFDPLQWAADFNADLESMDLDDIEAALKDPDANGKYDALKAKSPGTAKALDEAITARKAKLKGAR
jgi:phage recombination protein Bet